MNKSLALYVGLEFMQAGIEPYASKFDFVSPEHESAYYFYFFPDKISNSILYGSKYKQKAQEDSKRYVGNFMSALPDKSFFWQGKQRPYIELISEMLMDLKAQYHRAINLVNEKGKRIEMGNIPVQMAFASNVPDTAQQSFVTFFEENGFSVEISALKKEELIAAFIYNKQNLKNEENIVIAEDQETKIALTHLTVSANNNTKIIKTETINGAGGNPHQSAITQLLVETINTKKQIYPTQNELDMEYKLQYPRVSKIINTLADISETKRPEQLKINTTFKDGSSQTALISLDSITNFEQTNTQKHITTISNFLSESTTNKLIATGNYFQNTTVKPLLNSFELHFYDSIVEAVLRQLLLIHKTSDKKETTPSVKAYTKIDSIDINTLVKGDKIKLSNNDPRPGKGNSEQILEYLGDHKFVIISSTRSLQTGDFARAITENWVSGIQIDFMIERNGKLLGQFKTRPVVTIGKS